MKHQLSWIGLATFVVSLSGCPFKKQAPPVPQQAQAPSVQAERLPAPPETPPLEPLPPPPEAPPEKTEAAEKPAKRKPKKPASSATTSQSQQPASSAQPPAKTTTTSKLIIQEGNPASQGTLAAGGSAMSDSASRSKTTEQLLRETQGNLNGINRPLTPDEQGIVAQIKDYMAQSHKASDDSDTVRAHNLAVKAYLLSDELVKR